MGKSWHVAINMNNFGNLGSREVAHFKREEQMINLRSESTGSIKDLAETARMTYFSCTKHLRNHQKIMITLLTQSFIASKTLLGFPDY